MDCNYKNSFPTNHSLTGYSDLFYSPPLPSSTLLLPKSEPPSNPIFSSQSLPPATPNTYNNNNLPRSISEPSSSQQQSRFKRRKTTREKLQEMFRWWESAVKNTQQQQQPLQNDHTLDFKGCNGRAGGGEEEEGVCVERMGDYVSVHLKCPCGKAFQLLWSGHNGFYKLI